MKKIGDLKFTKVNIACHVAGSQLPIEFTFKFNDEGEPELVCPKIHGDKKDGFRLLHSDGGELIMGTDFAKAIHVALTGLCDSVAQGVISRRDKNNKQYTEAEALLDNEAKENEALRAMLKRHTQ